MTAIRVSGVAGMVLSFVFVASDGDRSGRGSGLGGSGLFALLPCCAVLCWRYEPRRR